MGVPAYSWRLTAALLLALGLTAGAVAQTPPASSASGVVSPLPEAAASAAVASASEAAAMPPGIAPVASQPVAPPAPVQAAAPTHPVLIEAERISAADTAWLMTSTALVLMMTLPGIALFYAGMVRKRNVLNTMACVVLVAAAVTMGWFLLGYSLSFTPGNGFMGGLERSWFEGFTYLKDKARVAVSHVAPNVPEFAYAMFQLSFAIITTALVLGAVVERMRFAAVVVFAFLWPLLVYAPVAHWVWEPGGWLAKMGVLDFAGGAVVHINAGVAGLVMAWMLGARRGYGREAFEPYNLGLTMVGTGLLWVGWFGFNAGSAVAADGRAGMAMLVTQVAAAGAALSWAGMEWMTRGSTSLLGLCSGVVAGLVAITPASGFVGPGAAALIGLIAGVACWWGATKLKQLLRVDDSLDVFGIHAIGGFVGALLTGVFNDPHLSGLSASLPLQALGAVAVALWSLLMTGLLMGAVNLLIGLRVHEDVEQVGLDVVVHRERIQ